MLDIAQRTAQETGVAEKIELKHGDADQLAKLFFAAAFDVILCYKVFEFVENPGDVLRGAARLMRDSSAIVSVLVRNQAGEVLKAGIQSGDLVAAEYNLIAQWANEQAVLTASSLTVIAERGVRVISDYLPPCVSRNGEYDQILKLERKLGSRPESAAVARYTHCLARRAGLVTGGGI